MFPSNLHKNIVQLDRQISLLENECKNMEVDKRRKGFKPEPPYSRCSKISSLQVKASPVKVTLKNTDSSKRNKKLTSPASGRLQSAGSLQSNCSQSCSETFEIGAGRKHKFCKVSATVPACSCRKLNGVHWNSRRKNKYFNCDFCKENSALDIPRCDGTEDKHDQVLHKELLFSNSGSTIEVTVTQKSSGGKEISPIQKTINLEEKNQKDGDNCKCQIKGQKWSEILCLDSSKKKPVKENMKSKPSPDETKTIIQPFSCNNKSGCEGNRSQENINSSNNINNLSIQEENIEVPVKLSSPPYKIINQNLPQINSNKFEKEIQCALENTGLKEPVLESKDPLKLIQHLVNQLKQMPTKEKKESPKGVETVPSKTLPKETLKQIPEEVEENPVSGDTAQDNTSTEVVEQHWENLAKEKELLSKELAAKDIIIATMNKREEEYLSLIAAMKLRLEKNKEIALGGIEARKELRATKKTMRNNVKFAETVHKTYLKTNKLLEKTILENQKLRTEIKIHMLEAQKHEVLLAGKEAEIIKYREEIQKFQRQISEHLAVIKSNAQGIDIEKMMQAIFQQSQIFLQTDLDSVVAEDDQKDSKLQNVLMHSSPTSTKTSVVNSSWKQISSIHDRDQTNGNSDVNLNDSNAKDFFQMFGENGSSASKSSKKAKEALIVDLLDEKRIKRSLSFTSCMSVHEEESSSSSSSSSSEDETSSQSSEETASDEEKEEAEAEENHRVSLEKAHSNIDEVLKNMKLKFSKQIFETSIANCTTDDFLDSQISSISQ